MKNILSILIIFVFVISIISCSPVTNSEGDNTENYIIYSIDGNSFAVDNFEKQEATWLSTITNDEYLLYDSSDLSTDILTNRNDKLVIERVVGIVTDFPACEGTVLNPYNEDFRYISYKSCDENIREGTIVVTYLVYNRTTNYVDDISERHDFVLSREYED